MIPPFNDHPLIQEYNGIKKYFRQYETPASRRRIRRFRGYSSLVGLRELRVAFDITGSLNFGMSTDRSDVDLVLYLECGEHGLEECSSANCERFRRIERLIREETRPGEAQEQYDIQIIDTINLTLLDRALRGPALDSTILIRFAFYRSVCRAVNARLLRPYQERLLEDVDLVAELRPELFSIFDSLAQSSRHQLSLYKYRERLADSGVSVSTEIQERIRGHLQQYQDHRAQGETSGTTV